MRHAFVDGLRKLMPLTWLLALLFLLRWVFYFANASAFSGIGLREVLLVNLQGFRFDAMTLVVANALWIVLNLLPLPGSENRVWRSFLTALFVAVNTMVLALCCIDLAYYGFNGKRLTRDLGGQAEVALRELPGMMLRFWWVTLAFAACVWALVKVSRSKPATGRAPWWQRAVAFVVISGTLVLVGRGGWQYQGLSPAHASQYVGPKWAHLVTNSAFTFGYSLFEPPLRSVDWFTPDELERRMPLRYEVRGDSTGARPNVVLLIVESLGREYIGALNNGDGYTPFLDSLCGRSLVFTDAYANAERSNKSICAILAGIPSFTDDAFMNTAFAGNAVEGLGTRLKSIGYSTAFFHGGLNGEYKFDAFSAACGFDRYFGHDEYGDPAGFDGHWGVYDEEFLLFTAERLGEMPAPFCAVAFTLSSHDPFMVPPRYKGRFPKGTQDIHEAMGYTDFALRRFFEKAAEQPWFANTLFVITGDHTFQYNAHPPWYSNPAGRFAVPIIVFSPDGRYAGTDARTAQHLDLLPTILDRCGYNGPVNSFGQSLFRRDRTDRAVVHLGGEYRLIQDGRTLLFNGREITGMFDHYADTLFQHDLRRLEPERASTLEAGLKAMIQQHARMLSGNRMTAR